MDRKFYKTLFRKHKLLFAIITVLVSITTYYFFPQSKEEVKLEHCIDGDTASFTTNHKTIKVRFLAINAPEIAHEEKPDEPYGIEAQNYTCNMLKQAKNIKLEFEAAKTDKYNRTLAWVFVDDKLLNEEIVKVGLAKVAYLYDKYKYTSQIKNAEKIAQKNKVNLWKH